MSDDSEEGRVFSETDAIQVAEAFLQLEPVKGVEVFGSIARKGQGKDVDLIVLVDYEIYDNFRRRVSSELRRHDIYYAYGAAGIRIRYAAITLMAASGNPSTHIPFDILYADGCVAGEPLDIFLFPEDWRERLVELQMALPHVDPCFMGNLAVDARQFNPEARSFRKA